MRTQVINAVFSWTLWKIEVPLYIIKGEAPPQRPHPNQRSTPALLKRRGGGRANSFGAKRNDSMKVLIVNTSELTGGAAVAANRLMKALKNNGVQAKMLVRDKQTDDISVVGIGKGWRSRLAFLWERWCIFTRLHFSKTHLFELDIANAGIDITRLPEFQEADVIHLHWINQGFLSLSGIQKMIDSGKPIVWTMHDIWPATAICHLTLGCRAYTHGCHHCKYLPERVRRI